MPTPLDSIAAELHEHIDWSRLELAPLASGAVLVDMRRFIRYLRKRTSPRLGYTRNYIRHLRAGASAEEIAAAERRWETALAGDLLMPYHGNALAALGPETILLAATPELCRRSAALVLANRTRWAEGYWGVTHSICELLRILFPLFECTDDDLLPIFGWLLTKFAVEWDDARGWTENTLGTSGHNWWAHTFLGFWMYGLFFPEFRGAENFRAFAGDYLARELHVLFMEDGWSKEGSPGYHEFAAGSLLCFAHLAKLNGFPLSAEVRQRLRLISSAGWRLLAPDGDFPPFGDAVRRAAYQGFHGGERPEAHPCMLLRRRAARFSLPEAKFVAEALQPEWQPPYAGVLPDEGQDLLPAYRRLRARTPASPDSCLPDSGFYVMRQDWTPHADYLALFAGPIGPRVCSHKHADLFAFELYSRGRRLLVDNWYGPPAEERDNDAVRMWRVSSAAHNTTTVDGLDHVPVLREFLFGCAETPTVDEWRSATEFAYFSAVHEGYYHQPARVSAVRRKIFYLRGGYWILLDRFTPITDDLHDYQLHFHLNAPAHQREDGSLYTSGTGGNLLIMPVPGAAGKPLLTPNPYPVPGYENPAHLCYTHRAAGEVLLATLLVPFMNDRLPQVAVTLLNVACAGRQVSPWEVTGLEITIDGRRDVYVDQHLQWNLPWIAGGFSGQRRVFHTRCQVSGFGCQGG